MTHRRVRSVRQSRSPTSHDGYPCRNGETGLDQRGRKTRRRTINSSIRNRHARSRPRLRRVPSVSPPLEPLAGSGNELLLLIKRLRITRHLAPRALASNHGSLPSTAPVPSIEGRDGRSDGSWRLGSCLFVPQDLEPVLDDLQFVGTRRFTSSIQLTTTLICVGGGATSLATRKRWPSEETSYPGLVSGNSLAA